MPPGLLIITHAGIGKALLSVATSLLHPEHLPVACIEVEFDADLAGVQEHAEQLLKQLDQGNGVLILTDAYGASPSNVACKLLEKHPVNIVTGINLPMLVRVLNYADQDLQTLTDLALDGAKQHIFQIPNQGCNTR